MPKSKKPGDQRLREPLPSLDDEVEESAPNEVETSTNQNIDSPKDRKNDTSSSEEVDVSMSRQDDTSTDQPTSNSGRQVGTDARTEADGPPKEETPPASRLQQQLQVLMEEVGLPADAPRMTEKTNAHISGDADERLREAVRVLETRYGKGFSKSLLVEYILRGALWDLRENAEDSQIVRVLDRIFDR